MNKIAKNHLLFRFIMLFNIVFITITTVFFILVNNSFSSLQIPSYLKETLNRMSILVFFFSFIIVLLNAYLLINHLFFNTKQYFKLASKIDFNDLVTTVGILNSLPSIDEYGDLGKNVTKLLRVYVNYADLMRKRLTHQDKKMKVLINQAKISVISFERDAKTKIYNLSYVSNEAKPFLELENSSSIIGKPLNALFSKDTAAHLQDIVSQSSRETSLDQTVLLETVEWVKPFSDKDPKDNMSVFLDVAIITFAFQFSDDYQYQDAKSNPANFNTIIDTFFILIYRKTIQQNSPTLPDSPQENTPNPEQNTTPSLKKKHHI